MAVPIGQTRRTANFSGTEEPEVMIRADARDLARRTFCGELGFTARRCLRTRHFLMVHVFASYFQRIEDGGFD